MRGRKSKVADLEMTGQAFVARAGAKLDGAMGSGVAWSCS